MCIFYGKFNALFGVEIERDLEKYILDCKEKKTKKKRDNNSGDGMIGRVC